MNFKGGVYKLICAWLTYRCRGAVRMAIYSQELTLEDLYGVGAWMLLPMFTILAPPVLIAGLVRYTIHHLLGYTPTASDSIWDVYRWVWSLPMEGAQIDRYLWDDVHGNLDRA